MQHLLKTRQEAYLNWLAGADHDLTADELKTINAYLFSKESDEIEKAAYTIYGEPLADAVGSGGHRPTIADTYMYFNRDANGRI